MVRTLDKGNRWRAKVADMLARVGLVEKRGIGYPGDDITVWVHGGRVILSVEAKNEQSWTPAAWLNQAETQATNGQVPLVVAHRRGKSMAEDGYVIMSGRTLVRLLALLIYTRQPPIEQAPRPWSEEGDPQ
jgi:hypothetical protein